MRNSHIAPLATAAACLLLAAGAGAAQAAATLTLKCAGKPHNEDSAGTKLCTANGGRAGKIIGAVRNDAGQPVAGTVTVEYIDWNPVPSGGYQLKVVSTKQVTANAAGELTITSDTPTRQSIRVTLAADPALGISTSPVAEAEVQRRFTVVVKKLGGGSVKLTVKGTKVRPMKISLTDPSGYYVPGIPKVKKVDAQNSVVFNLGNRTGKFGYYVDTGVYDDLFWPQARGTKFRMP